MLNYPISIDKVTLNGFRALENVEITCLANKGYIPLLGANGTGKTSLLEAIEFCLTKNSSKFNSINEGDFRGPGNISVEIIFDRFFLLGLTGKNKGIALPFIGISKQIKRRGRKTSGALFSSPYVVNTTFHPLIGPIDDTKVPNEIQKDWRIAKVVKRNDDLLICQIAGQEIEVFFGELEGAERILFPEVFYLDKGRDKELLTNYNTVLKDLTTELDWRFRRRAAEEENLKLIREPYNLVHDAISKLIAEDRALLLTPASKLLSEELGLTTAAAQLEFFAFNLLEPHKQAMFGHRVDPNTIVPVGRLGSGISILAALALVIGAALQSKNSLVLLIDEPEMHLHGDLQKRLVSFLKNQPFQTLAATHSHLFVEREKPTHNIRFSREEFSVAVEPCDALTLGVELYDILGYSLDDLYIPRKLILVEGPFDERIVSKCLELEKVNNPGILLVCRGKDNVRPKIEELYGFFERNINRSTLFSELVSSHCFVLVDGDVAQAKLDSLAATFGLKNEALLRLKKGCLEYYFPLSLVQGAASSTMLRDGRCLADLEGDNIVKIVLADEKLKPEEKTQVSKPLSKQRLNNYVAEFITLELYESEECAALREVVASIVSYVRK